MKDFTSKVGQDHMLSPACPVPREKPWEFVSFDYPATLFWNGFVNALVDRGWTEQEIVDQLKSKGTRWFLDKHGEIIEQLGYSLGWFYEKINLR